jgi:hypothetical protein
MVHPIYKFEFWLMYCLCKRQQKFQKFRNYGIWRHTFIGIVSLDVADMMPGQLVDSSLNFSETTRLTHLVGRKVGVSTSSVPVTL